MKLKSLAFVLGLVLVSTCTYAQKGKNIEKAIEAAVSRKAVGAAAKAPKVPKAPTAAKAPVTPRAPAAKAATTAPKAVKASGGNFRVFYHTKAKVVTGAKVKGSADKFTPVKYPIEETKEEFLARWNAMTFEQQIADAIAFEDYRRSLDFNLNNYSEMTETQQEEFSAKNNEMERVSFEYRFGILSKEQHAIVYAYKIGLSSYSPKEFEARMESFLLTLQGKDGDGDYQLALLRPTVLARAGKEGPEHAITPQEQEEYAQVIRHTLEPERTSAILFDNWAHTRNTWNSAFEIGEKRFEQNTGGGGSRLGTSIFVERKTGTMGFVIEVPGPTTVIDDGINPPQVVDPKTQVIFYVNDPAGAKQVAYVEERAKFEDPYAYNLIWPRSQQEKLAAEQPLPANAGAPADPEAYAKLRKEVLSYKKKYYKNMPIWERAQKYEKFGDPDPLNFQETIRWREGLLKQNIEAMKLKRLQNAE